MAILSSSPDRPRLESDPAIAAAWLADAEPLADWAFSRLIARRDVFGAYNRDGGQYTAHEALTRDVLLAHFRGGRVIGAHTTSTDGLCLAITWDIDAHDDKADPDANWRFALAVRDRLAGLGLDALICDSNGKGGYHVRAFFKKPIPAAVAYWLGERISADWADHGFASPPEFFPKQPELTLAAPYGNWLRLPGRHHKRPHWTRIHEPAADRWLDGPAAVQRLLKVAGDNPGKVLAAYDAERKAREGSAPAPASRAAARPHRGDKADEATVREALDRLPGDWTDSYGGRRADTGWLGVGMALHDWDPGRGLDLWKAFSGRSPTKYDAAVCEAKWATFTQGGGLGIGTIFKEAERNGWEPPWQRNGHAEPANGKHHGNGANGDGRGCIPLATPTPDPYADDGGPEITDEWPVPGDLMFHGIAGEIVRAVDPHTEGDPAATLVQLMVAFANMLGRGPHFMVSATRHYLSLFAALVGPTSIGRKGTSWDIVLWLLRHFDPEWADDHIQGGLVSGEGLIYHVRDPVTKRESSRPKGAALTTTQAVTVDDGIGDKRLLAVETELSRMFKAMGRDGNTLSDVLRQAWDCKRTLQILSKNSPNKATDAHVSVIGHITKADVLKHMTETESANGFGNRFLWVCVRRSKELPDGGDIDSVAWARFQRRLDDRIVFARAVTKMTRDAGAKAMWHDVYSDLSGPRPGLLGAILGRAVPQVMRLACIYALLDGAADVGREHLAAALQLWKYAERSARLVFGGSLGDPDAEKLMAGLRSNPGGLTRNEIRVKVFAGHMTKERVAALLQRLLNDGLVSRTTESTGGRPAERWFAGSGARKGGSDAR